MSIIPHFLARFVQKMSMTKVKMFSVTSVIFEFILNVTTLIIQITGIFKTVMNLGIVQNVAAQFFLSTPYQATTSSQFVVLTLIVTSHSGKIWKIIIIAHLIIIKSCSNLEFSVNQFNNATPESSNNLGKASSKYDIEEMYDIDIPHENKSVSLFYKNACSLNKT